MLNILFNFLRAFKGHGEALFVFGLVQLHSVETLEEPPILFGNNECYNGL